MNEAIKEILKKNVKESISSVLSMLLGKDVQAEAGEFEEATKDVILNRFAEYKKVVVSMFEHSESGGELYFILSEKFGGLISNFIMGVEEEKESIGDEDIDALTEVGNQVVSNFGIALKNELEKDFSFSQPKTAVIELGELYERIKSDDVVFSEIEIKIADKSDRLILALSDELSSYFEGEEESSSEEEKVDEPIETSKPASSPVSVNSKIEMLLDVELPVVIRIGKTEMYLKNILKLGTGSIIQLDKVVDEPVELFVNDKLIARGEVVVVESNFALRITEIVSKEERIKSLG